MEDPSGRFICPFCGKVDCKSFLHLVRLSALPVRNLQPGKRVMLYLLVVMFVLFCLLLVTAVKLLTPHP